MLKRLFLIVVILGLSAATFADSPFDGNWSANVARPAPAGNQKLDMMLNTMGGVVTGNVLIQGGTASAIDWGFVKGDLITFKLKMPFNGDNNTITFVYIGRLVGDQINFGRRPEDLTKGRLVEFTAQRIK